MYQKSGSVRNSKQMKVVFNIWLLILGCFVMTVQSTAQPVTVEANIDTSAILIGDQVNFQFRVIKPEGLRVTFPNLQNELADGIEIVDKPEIDSTFLDNGQLEIVQNYKVTSFDSGLYYIPPFDFAVEQNNITDTLSTEAGYLEVFTVPVSMQDNIKDIKGPFRAPITFLEILPYLMGAIIIALAIIIIRRYLAKKKAVASGKVIQKPKEPPHIIALRELEQLKQKKLWQQGKVKEYYSELTEIIRRYIECRFDIYALEQTSDEIFTAFKNKQLDKELYFELLRQLLIKADLVKFAKDQPLPDENETYFNHAYSFVEHSKKIEKTDDGVKDEREETSAESVEPLDDKIGK